MDSILLYSIPGWSVLDTSVFGDTVMSYKDDTDCFVLAKVKVVQADYSIDSLTQDISTRMSSVGVCLLVSGSLFINDVRWLYDTYSVIGRDGVFHVVYYTEFEGKFITIDVTVEDTKSLSCSRKCIVDLITALNLDGMLSNKGFLCNDEGVVIVTTTESLLLNPSSSEDTLFFFNSDDFASLCIVETEKEEYFECVKDQFRKLGCSVEFNDTLHCFIANGGDLKGSVLFGSVLETKHFFVNCMYYYTKDNFPVLKDVFVCEMRCSDDS